MQRVGGRRDGAARRALHLVPQELEAGVAHHLDVAHHVDVGDERRLRAQRPTSIWYSSAPRCFAARAGDAALLGRELHHSPYRASGEALLELARDVFHASASGGGCPCA